MRQSFSERHELQGPERDISVRYDAPPELRVAVIQLAKRAGLNYSTLRDVVCEVLPARPNRNNWSEDPNIRDEVFSLLENCDWFKVYDLAEAIYDALLHHTDKPFAEPAQPIFRERLNQFFREQGIGWEMENGKVRYRGTEPFARTVEGAATDLSNTGRSQAASELAEAVRDISRRPKPDITGAVQHAMAALEATARDVTGQSKPTLGKLVGSLGLTPPLDAALEKLWGYASNEARHGREDGKLSPAEAELIVGVSGAVCGYLAKTNPEPRVAGSDN